MIRGDSSVCFPNLRFPRLHLSELQLHQHPPDVPDKLRWSSCRTVELCETLWNCFSAPGSHGCQWYAIYANGHSRASVTNKSKWSASVSAALVFTQIIDSKKKPCASPHFFLLNISLDISDISLVPQDRLGNMTASIDIAEGP